ncbi:MAG: cbb3-type cytochrome c oxidase subunit 3 [Pseudomonas sp.]|jgi:cytochrome c oxidase cbb3-type subunit 4|nr:cbb3-type cytochrome c oxidase subunit 3 [Pseudomonas sp.]MDY0414183.1 cbb3-type cytochrome c oxidase subunit 3 [Pseudomonas sp.]NLO54277.1 cbb3-type cytochrome c oxidase subunit 3 [Gammaproteobacteria bacterium]
MDIGTLRGLGTALILVAFIGLVFWAYSSKRNDSFTEAAMLPFSDEPNDDTALVQNHSRSTHQ